MPIKDQQKSREYKRLWMANKRKQQKGNVEPVEPNNFVEPLNVEPKSVEPLAVVEPMLKVEPVVEPVEPKHVKPKSQNQPCQLNHTSLTELWQQAKEQVKQAWQEIIQQGGINQCLNCHNSQRNHQLALNLLEKYWGRVKKGEKTM